MHRFMPMRGKPSNEEGAGGGERERPALRADKVVPLRGVRGDHSRLQDKREDREGSPKAFLVFRLPRGTQADPD